MTTADNQNPRITRNILFLLFALPGLFFASWVSRTPTVRDLLQVSTAEMGLLLFAISAGSLTSLLTAGSIVARKGARLVILVSSLMIVVGFMIIGMGVALTMLTVVIGGLIVFGCGFGAAEVALNIEGSAVEKVLLSRRY